MIRSEPLIEIVRIYDGENIDPYADYVAVFTLVHDSKNTVWIRALSGKLSRKNLRELVNYLYSREIFIVKADRALDRRIPFTSKRDGMYVEIDIKIAYQAWFRKELRNCSAE